jgi:ribonucleotide reductase alpha subunit
MKYGARNSLLVAPMPTASTAQILGNNEIFEPFTSNLYLRRVLSGEFVCLNKHLVRDLIEAKLWTYETRQMIIKYNGSIQDIEYIPDWIKRVYRTIWEYNYKDIINLAIDRAPFIDQSQSLNV